MPSCIRMPPEAETTISGWRFSADRSTARVSTSPTTVPTLPPINFSSSTQMLTGRPLSLPDADTIASFSEVAFFMAASRSL